MEKVNVMQELPSHTPTAAELYALERRAREERARYVAAGLASAARSLKSLVGRGLAAVNAKAVHHA
jgi:hypothetical protein